MAAPARRGWWAEQKWSLIIALVGVVLAAAVTWVIAPGQEVRSQRAVEESQRRTAEREPALRAKASYAFIPQDGETYALKGTLSPSAERRLIDQEQDFTDFVKQYNFLQIAPPGGGGPRSEQRMLSRLEIFLEGRRFDPLIIKSIKARIVKRERPLDGTLILGPPQGEQGAANIGFDLDAKDLSARRVSSAGRLGGLYRSSNFITLAYHEPMVVNVVAHTSTCYCEWVIDMTVGSNGKDENITIDDAGRPFRVTALAKKYQSKFQWSYPRGPFDDRRERFDKIVSDRRPGQWVVQ